MQIYNDFLLYFAFLGQLWGSIIAIRSRVRNVFYFSRAGKNLSQFNRLLCTWYGPSSDLVHSYPHRLRVCISTWTYIACSLLNALWLLCVIFQVLGEAFACCLVSALLDHGFDITVVNSYFIDIFTVEHYGADRDLRNLLDIKRLVLFRPSQHHTHGSSASERTGASRSLAEAIQNAGLKPYVVSMASTDQTHGLNGNRLFYWAKDLKPNFQFDKVEDTSCFMMVDVDYYCDMDQYLRYFKPILLYTLQPSSVSYRSSEYAYYIKDNNVHYEVSGGGRYNHAIWDYDHDTLQTRDWFGFNCVFHVVTKTIENKELPASGRRIVSIVPLRKVAPFCHIPKGVTIKRKQFTYDGVNIIHDNVRGQVSISENGTFESVHLTTKEYTALRSIAVRKEKELFKGDVQSILRRRYKPGEQPPYVEFELETPVIAHLMSKIIELPINAIATTGIPVKREAAAYTANGPDTLNENKFPGQIICSQLASSSAILPAKNNNNSCASIMGRLTEVRNSVIPSRQYGSYADEFSRLVVPDELHHKGCPIDLEQVKQYQSRPLQKARIKATELTMSINPDNTLKTFIKNEPYNCANHPRNITTMSPELTLTLSAYTYAFKEDCLKCLDSYGPGKTPLQIAQLLQNICRNGCILTDYTRFDGTISEWLQKQVVKRCYNRWSSDPAFISQLIDKIFKQRGITSEGKQFSSFYGTRSGSPTTTDGNTLINMYIIFCALRRLGFSKDQAFALLGIYAGDDGVTPLIPGLVDAIHIVVKDLGLDVKLDVSHPGQPMNFLGRIFPDILTTISSHQDMARTLPKLHISTNQQVTREQAAYNKAAGYIVTDPLTPILGAWAKRVIDITNLGSVKNELREEHYKRVNEAWPQLESDVLLLTTSVADQLGLTVSQIREANDEILNTDALFEFPVIWDNDSEDKINALIGESMVIVSDRDPVINEQQLLIPSTSNNDDRYRENESNPAIRADRQDRVHIHRVESRQCDERPPTIGRPQAPLHRGILRSSKERGSNRSDAGPIPQRLHRDGTSNSRKAPHRNKFSNAGRVCVNEGQY